MRSVVVLSMDLEVAGEWESSRLARAASRAAASGSCLGRICSWRRSRLLLVAEPCCLGLEEAEVGGCAAVERIVPCCSCGLLS